MVEVENHETFKRNGADLLMTKDITLMEALTGIQFDVRHLDGELYKIQADEDKVIKPGEIMMINGMGMPFHKKASKFGSLYIMFNIKFP